MSQDLKAANAKALDVLKLIEKKTLDENERKQMVADSAKYWRDHVNEGFLQYRKSVSTDYTAVDGR